MAYFRVGNGGTLSETPLWTNNDPTLAQADPTYILNPGIDGFQYIKFTYRIHRTSDTTDASYIISVDDFLKCVKNTSGSFAVGLTAYYSNAYYCRRVFWESNTSIRLYHATNVSNGSNSTAICILESVKGLK